MQRTLYLFLTLFFYSIAAWSQSNLITICNPTYIPSGSGGSGSGLMQYDTIVGRVIAPGADMKVLSHKYYQMGARFYDSAMPGEYSYLSGTFALFHFDGPSDIGIDSGILISTGRTGNVSPLNPFWGGIYPGPSLPASFNSSGYNSGNTISPWAFSFFPNRLVQGPADLLSLNNGDSIIDASVLEIDFVPMGNNIRLQYVFASEEYPSNACAEANDVMGIFLSKPGVPGYQNIATVPGGANLPVSTRTINDGTGTDCEGTAQNPQYYVDNANGQNVIFNGFTTPLWASASVTPCDTYRLRIGIADGAKHIGYNLYQGSPPPNIGTPDWHPLMSLFDSGIFIKAGSLTSVDNLWVQAMGGSTGNLPYAVRNNCMPAKFRIYRQTVVNAPVHLQLAWGGTAQVGVDYAALPFAVTIPSNQAFVDVPITALPGNGSERTLALHLLSPYNQCNNISPDTLTTATLSLYPQLPVQILTADTTICNGCSIDLQAESLDAGLQYQWFPAASLSNSTVLNPVATPQWNTRYDFYATVPNTVCVGQDSVRITISSVGVQELEPGVGLQFVPNPFDNRLQIAGEDKSGFYQVQVCNILGQVQLSISGTMQEVNHYLLANAGRLSPGNYIGKVTFATGSKTFKLVSAN